MTPTERGRANFSENAPIPLQNLGSRPGGRTLKQKFEQTPALKGGFLYFFPRGNGIFNFTSRRGIKMPTIAFFGTIKQYN